MLRQIRPKMEHVLLYLLAAGMLLLSVSSFESRVYSAHFDAAATAKEAVYRCIPSHVFSDDARKEQLSEANTRLSQSFTIRLDKRALRLLSMVLFAGMLSDTASFNGGLYTEIYQAILPLVGLLFTIQYIHDLDGKKSTFIS